MPGTCSSFTKASGAVRKFWINVINDRMTSTMKAGRYASK
jgi:hypothetical protein